MVGGHLELAGVRRVEGKIGEVFLLPERGKAWGHLGHVTSSYRVSADPSKIEAVSQ